MGRLQKNDNNLATLVYALQETGANHSYVGATNNFTRRLGEHNGVVKNRGARYTRGKLWTPIFLVKGYNLRNYFTATEASD